MSAEITSRLEEFRREIRRKDKEAFFRQRREQLLESDELLQSRPVEMLRQEGQARPALEEIQRRVMSANYYQETLQLREEGLLGELVGCIREGRVLEESFETLCLIFEHDELQWLHGGLYQGGLLELLLQHLGRHALTPLCSYLLLKFTSIDDYCLALLYNKAHRLLIRIYAERQRLVPDPSADNQATRVFSCLLGVLENLIGAKEGTLDLEADKQEILAFVARQIEGRMFLRKTLGTLYDALALGGRMRDQALLVMREQVDALLREATTESPYLYNLFACIVVSLPLALDTKTFLQLGVQVPKLQRPMVYFCTDVLVYLPQFQAHIPRDDAWWDKVFASPVTPEVHCMMLKLVHRLAIQQDWVWRVLSAALESDSHSVAGQAIEIISLRVRQEHGQAVMVALHKHMIPQTLQRLATKAMREELSTRAESVLDFLAGPMSVYHDGAI